MTPDPYCSTCRGAGTVEPDAGATVRPWCRACSGTGLGEQELSSPLLRGEVRACTWRGTEQGCGCCEDCPECVCTGQ